MNRLTRISPTLLGFTALATLMLLTRFHHEGSGHALPDASMAIFFIGGLMLQKGRWFSALMGLAVVIDALAINVMGVSGVCVSVAYGFLIPAYAVLWGGGRFAAHWQGANKNIAINLRFLLPMLAIVLFSTYLSYALSTLSFYALAGFAKEVTWSGFWQQMATYSPYALQSTLAYSAVMLAVVGLVHVIRDHKWSIARV